jgi:hypothetical protein
MKITFTGHSSIHISFTNGKGLLMDPWYKGKVFNDSWAMVSKAYEVPYDQINYLWISHEHPDHFNIPSLKMFPLEAKERIEVLHQKHSSLRMVKALRGMLGFKNITELGLYNWVKLDEDIHVFCGSVGTMDSFIAVRSGGKTVLNLNDCVLNSSQLSYLKRKIGHIDILFTQFSFANWVGNTHDEMKGAERKKLQLAIQHKLLSPSQIVPFASFVYFCNEENSRMNEWANFPIDIDKLGINGLRFMYPGDTVAGELRVSEQSNQKAIQAFMNDYSHMEIAQTPSSTEVEKLLKTTQASLNTFLQKSLKGNRLDDLVIRIKDINQTLKLKFSTNQVEVSNNVQGEMVDMEMCSQAAQYLFEFPWGASTLQISGMYLDFRYEKKGTHPFFLLQNRIATKFIAIDGLSSAWRVSVFLWKKKWEIFYRFSDSIIKKLSTSKCDI